MYKAPILFLSPDSGHITFPDTAAVCEFLKAYLVDQAKSGRTGTEIENIEISCFQKALLWPSRITLSSVPMEIAKTGWFYIFQKEAGTWRAASLAPRDLPN